MKAAAAAVAALALWVPGVVGADSTALGIGYICGAERSAAHPGPTTARMLAGVGNGSSRADTSNPQAQAWFDEGLNLYHAFNHNEASAAFAKAAALDPTCALCAWGVALGLGQTLNYAITAPETALALTQAERARKLVKPGDTRAEGLISALQVRYGKDTPDAKRDTLYGQAMDDMVRRFPGDDEIANLAVHALLIPARHEDRSGVPRAEAILKTVLARKPNDTAAIHYYIHATEFAGHPAEALPYANRLAGLAPGASHLVHMAAHTLMHVGQYERVAIVNAEALKVDADVESKLGYAGPLSSQVYYLHNYSFGLAGALMAGDRELALKYADHAAVAFPAAFDHGAVQLPPGVARVENPVSRRSLAEARGLVAYGRYDWRRALALPEVASDPRLVKIYRHYARGEAFAFRHYAADVRREADAIAALGAEAQKAGEPGNVNLAAIAGDVLAGRAAMLTNHPEAAVEIYARAAARQEKDFPFADNFDPPPWWYPVRRSLAAAELAADRPDEAVREAKASLAAWPRDPLALKVLAGAEVRQGHIATAGTHLAQARSFWRGGLDEVPLALI